MCAPHKATLWIFPAEAPLPSLEDISGNLHAPVESLKIELHTHSCVHTDSRGLNIHVV